MAEVTVLAELERMVYAHDAACRCNLSGESGMLRRRIKVGGGRALPARVWSGAFGEYPVSDMAGMLWTFFLRMSPAWGGCPTTQV